MDNREEHVMHNEERHQNAPHINDQNIVDEELDDFYNEEVEAAVSAAEASFNTREGGEEVGRHVGEQPLNGNDTDSDDPDYYPPNDEVESEGEVWLAEDFEGPEDDDIFIERPEGYALHTMRRCMAAMRTTRGIRRDVREKTRNGASSSHNVGNDDYYSDVDIDSEEEFDKKCLSDSEDDEGYEEWKEKNYPDMGKFQMEVGMLFTTRAIFREVLRDWVVRNGWDLTFLKNEKKRITAVCKTGCEWSIRASCVGNTDSYQVKTIRGKHTCSSVTENKQATYKYLAKRLLPDLREHPDLDLEEMKRKIQKMLDLDVGKHTIWRAKRYALEIIRGDSKKEYERLWDYCAAVEKENGGSTLVMKLNRELDPPALERMYFGLSGLKNGFLAGCRPIIGLDGCFLKGAYRGQLLSAVGRDGNDNLYPIALAFVGSENYDTWYWFLDILLREIGSFAEKGWTFISDRQKGLIEAVDELAAGAEHRYCLRHMYNNFKTKFRGLNMKKLFWEAASVSTICEWERKMKEIKDTYPAVEENEVTPYVWLNRVDPKHWARSHFSNRSKCCSLVNNMSESFNSYLLGGRDLPIISMWEWIRSRIMERIQIKFNGMVGYDGIVCPNIMKKMEADRKKNGENCYPTFAGGYNYQVLFHNETHVVKLDERTCTCGMFQLCGYPCCHAISAIRKRRTKVGDYVAHWYLKDTYLAIYSHFINPVPGLKFVESTGKGPIQPPIRPVAKAGRPQKKRRRDGNDARDTTKASRRGQIHNCSNCLIEGHNFKRCKNPTHKNSKHYKGSRNSGGQGQSTQVSSNHAERINQMDQGPNDTRIQTQDTQLPAYQHVRKLPTWMRKQAPQPARSTIYVVPPRDMHGAPPAFRASVASSAPHASSSLKSTCSLSSDPVVPNMPPKKPCQKKMTEKEVLERMKERRRGHEPF